MLAHLDAFPRGSTCLLMCSEKQKPTSQENCKITLIVNANVLKPRKKFDGSIRMFDVLSRRMVPTKGVKISPRSPRLHRSLICLENSGWKRQHLGVQLERHRGIFEMPEDWVYSETHTDLFQLAHHLLVEPWDKSVMDQWQPTRQPGWRPGLAFSGGVDSATALCLMPDSTVLLYHERCALSGKLSHANAHRFFEHIESTTGRRVHRIRSNHEKIRQTQGQSIGFSTDYACAVHAVLLADYFSLDSIATGMPLENSYLFHGHQYRDFASSRFWNHYSKMFADVGLPLYQPVAAVRRW